MVPSSTKTECLRSALLAEREAGVMCSATHIGLRVRRSKEEVVERVEWRSLMGPGKPYWKRPLGFTGGTRFLRGYGWAGMGADGEVVVGRFAVVGTATGVVLRSGREEYSAAVAAAPVAAEMPAMTAKVVFDMMVTRRDKRVLQGEKGASSPYEAVHHREAGCHQVDSARDGETCLDILMEAREPID